MPIKLKNLIVNRVDLVDKGDNPEAHITLFKRKEAEDRPSWVDNIIERIDKLLNREGVNESMFDFQKFLGQLTDKDLVESINKMSTEEKEDIAKQLEALSEEDRTEEKVKELLKAEDEDNIETLKARIAELEKLLKEATEEEEDPTEKEDEEDEEEDTEKEDDEEDEMMKNLPESVRKLLHEANERAAEAEKVAKELKDSQALAKYTDIAKQYSSVAAPADALGAIFKRMAENNEEDFNTINGIFKSMQEVVSRHNIILKEIGEASPESTDGDPWKEIEAKANEILKNHKDMTKEQAIAKVLRDKPELYSEYQKSLNEKEG